MIAVPLRVGVIGARRRQQGTGEHIARFLEAAGARVVAIAGTSDATVAEARGALESRWGIRAEGYTDVRAMVAEEKPDALVIASPAAFHAEHLQIALEARLHVLCEKPLVAPRSSDLLAEVTRLLNAFVTQSRLLMVNEQWPWTLAAYRALFPDVDPARAASFRMRLSPLSIWPEARDAVLESMPHALSLLSAVYPDAAGPLADVRVLGRSPGGAFALAFSHPGSNGPVACSVELIPRFTQPRPASYAFDGHEAHRVIEEPGYRMSLATDEGRGGMVSMADPMESLVRDFVARASSSGPFPRDPTLALRSSRLCSILAALPDLGCGSQGQGIA